MIKPIKSSIYLSIAVAMLMAWAPSSKAQVIIIQPNQDDSCAVSFDENWNQINIGHYVGKKKSWCGLPSKPACHLPEWDLMGGSLLVQGVSDVNVVADGPFQNCSGVFMDGASNVTVSDIDCQEAGGGVLVTNSNNITLRNLSFQLAEGAQPSSLDVQNSQGVTASGLSFEGGFDRANVQASSDVKVDRSYFEVSNNVSFSNINIFESSDVSFSKVVVNGGGGGVTMNASTDVSLSQARITPGADSTFPSILDFDSTGININQVTIDRRAVASSNCVNLNGSSEVTIANNKCLSDPANSSDYAIIFTQVSDYLVTRNLLDGSASGIFITDQATGEDSEGEISRNTVNVNGAYGIFLSGASGVDVIRNNFTNSAGIGTGAFYYDEAGIPPNTVPLIINFEKNKYSGFEFNGECNSLEMICP
ncbi:MAG TPA: right-handed parallel beta-helix repeat-containing protein [bacterium]|nr:right-handed parallel beta-helix repeat-containing protein [bacterium]